MRKPGQLSRPIADPYSDGLRDLGGSSARRMLSSPVVATVDGVRRWSGRGRASAALIPVGSLLLVVVVLMIMTQLGYASKTPCARFGPAPAGAIRTDAEGSVREARSWWPIGTVCNWERIDGAGTVRSQVGSDALTAATYGIAALGFLSTIVGASQRQRAAPDR